ncbi:MAG: hypothetical protein AB8E15_10820 [Bdellovibrionales bacterium]
MKHQEAIGLSFTCGAMIFLAAGSDMNMKILAIIVGITSLVLINRYYQKLIN